MKLRRLCKSAGSGTTGQCPAMYVAAETPTVMVAQGYVLDADTAAELQEVGANESGVSVDVETVLRAAAILLAEHDRPAMLAEVEDFLAGWPDAAR